MDIISIVISCAAVGFGEELVFRGYIFSRWLAFSRSPGQAVMASSLLFGISHAYQGFAGIANAGAIGVVYAVGFLFVRRLWPLVIAHAMLDIFIFLTR